MKMRFLMLVLLLGCAAVRGEIAFQLVWQVPGTVTAMDVSDLNEDGYYEVLLGTGYSYGKMINTPSGPRDAIICEGLMHQYDYSGSVVWEKKVCQNDAASDPCYSNGCISVVYADTICTTTRKLIFVGCCYCGNSSIVRVYDASGELLQELYDRDAGGNPVPISGCVRKILADDIDADNCKEIIVVTTLEFFIYDTDCITCTIPTTPTLRSRDILPVGDRPSGTLFDVIVVAFDDDASPTKEIVVAADEVSVYEHDLTLKWQYEIDPARPVRALYAFDVDSDTAAHEIDQDPDLEPELIVGESWYIYVLDNMEQGNTNPADDLPNLKWEYSTSPYDVTCVYADNVVSPRCIVGGSATIVSLLDYNGALLKSVSVPTEARYLRAADFDQNGQKELVVFSSTCVSIFSATALVWTSATFEGIFLRGVIQDINLDGYPDIVAAYTGGVYVIGMQEIKSQIQAEADRLYDTGKSLLEKGEYVEALVYFEQARAKYGEAGDTFMGIQCQKKISECEKSMDTERIVAAAMEELRNLNEEQAGLLFGQAADLYAKSGDKSKMSQLRVLKETCEKLAQANSSLLKGYELLLDGKWKEAKAEAEWAQRSFEDVSSVFLTMSLDSVYEILKIEISGKMRECEEIQKLCDKFVEADFSQKEADKNEEDANRYFRYQQYSEARYAHEEARSSYMEAADLYDEVQIALGRGADGFRRSISDIETKKKTLQESELYRTYGDIQTARAIETLEKKEKTYEELIDEYEALAESVEKKARECREKASLAQTKARESYSSWDKFQEYGSGILQPPTSLAVGLACLIVVLIGVAAGKGRYVALVFLVLVLIFLGVSALRFWGIHL